MSTDLFLSATLTAHGNAWLHGYLAGEERDFLRDSPLIRYVNELRFGDVPAAPPLAAVAGWLERLRAAGARRLWLVGSAPASPAPAAPAMMEGFANAMIRGILVELAAEPYALFSRWNFQQGLTAWSVAYEHVPLNRMPRFPAIDLAAGLARLGRETAAARDFAAEQGQERWVEWLSGVMAMLGEAAPEQRFLPRRGYADDARRLIAAANQAWVFGGMGSWNDMGFTDEATRRRYEQVTGAFYEAVVDAVYTAANAFTIA